MTAAQASFCAQPALTGALYAFMRPCGRRCTGGRRSTCEQHGARLRQLFERLCPFCFEYCRENNDADVINSLCHLFSSKKQFDDHVAVCRFSKHAEIAERAARLYWPLDTRGPIHFDNLPFSNVQQTIIDILRPTQVSVLKMFLAFCFGPASQLRSRCWSLDIFLF